jgi:Tol biopolymer transport system component
MVYFLGLPFLQENVMLTKLFLPIMLIHFMLVSCTPVVYPEVNLSWSEGEIVFFSTREIYRNGRHTDGKDSLFLMNQSGTEIAILREIDHTLGFPAAWEPNGTEIAVTIWDDTENAVCINIVTAVNKRCLVKYSRAPSWSPDGRWLAFQLPGSDHEPQSLNLYNLESDKTNRLVDLPNSRIDAHSAWSPDSQWIAYEVHDEINTTSIWLISVNGGSTRFLTTGKHPDWSLSNDEITFSHEGNIWIYNLSTNEKVLFIEDPVEASWPAWSHDGKQMLFTSRRNGNAEIFLVNKDGSNMTNLTSHPSDDMAAVWRPIGK